MTKLETLAERIYQVSQKRPTEAYHEDWLKVMSVYPYEIVERVWLQIRVNVKNWEYFDLKTWVNKCDYLHDAEKLEKESKKPHRRSRVQKDRQMRVWTKNYHHFIKRRVRRGEYLKRAVKIGQMHMYEADKERNIYKNRGDSLDEFADITNVVM